MARLRHLRSLRVIGVGAVDAEVIALAKGALVNMDWPRREGPPARHYRVPP